VPAPFPRHPPTLEQADPDDPFSSTSKHFTGFVSASASHLKNIETGRISPESGPSDHDDIVGGSTAPAIGFTSASNLSDALTSFAPASALLGGPASPTRRGSPSPQQSQDFDVQVHTDGRPDSFGCAANDASVNPLSMFTSFGKKKDLFQPSAAAVKAALERAKRWEAEDDSVLAVPPDALSDKHTDVELPQRQALLSVENLSQRSTVTGQIVSETANAPCAAPGPPSVSHQLGFSSASRVETGGTFRSANFSTPSALGNTSFQTSSVSSIKGKSSVKPFKSPLLSRSAIRAPGNRQVLPSLLNPATSTPARESRPTMSDCSTRPTVVPASEAMFTTPIPDRSTPMRKIPARKFVTPFKPGIRPGEHGHAQLKACYDAERVNTTSGPSTDNTQSTSNLTRKSTRRRYFDLSTL
jgi:breast cancer 2 susceptibility protein